MTDIIRLQDKVARGMGLAARKYGSLYTVYRPKEATQPICERTRVIRLCASFDADAHGLGGARDAPTWTGTFDTLYTHQSDYLVSEQETFFIATQMPLRPVRCVRINRIVTIVRPTFANEGQYSGLYASPGENVIEGWPACIFQTGGPAGIVRSGEVAESRWTLLLPRMQVGLQTADVVSDDVGSSYVVGAAEESVSGWRLLLRQVGP